MGVGKPYDFFVRVTKVQVGVGKVNSCGALMAHLSSFEKSHRREGWISSGKLSFGARGF